MSTTPNYALYKPAVNETGWGAAVDSNFDTIDAALIAAANVPVTLTTDTTLTTNQNLVHCTGTLTKSTTSSPKRPARRPFCPAQAPSMGTPPLYNQHFTPSTMSGMERIGA